MLALIGNAPSSGSNFLRDLIDASKFSYCGNELEYFGHPGIYRPHEFAQNPRSVSISKQMYATGIFPKFHRLDTYNVTEAEMLDLMRDTPDFAAFADAFSNLVLDRNDLSGGVLFEKTPQNLNCIGEFLESYPKGHFVSIVRNPLYVFSSMRRRDFGRYMSATTWIVDVAQIWPYLNSDRFHLLRYEDLIQDPFNIAANLINAVAGTDLVDAESIEASYLKGDFHSTRTGKAKPWSVKERGTLANANKRQLPKEELQVLKSVMASKISVRFSERFDLPDLSLMEAATKFGYSESIADDLSTVEEHKLKKDSKDWKKLGAKWIRGLKTGAYHLSDWKILLNAIEHL